MKARTLLWLAVVLAALVVVAVIQRRSPSRPAAGGFRSGSALFPALDVNAAAALELRFGTNTVRIVKEGGQWVVATLWNYPADFDKLADNLRAFAGLKVGETIAGGTQYLKDFGLAAVSNQAPLQLRLTGAAGKELAALEVGHARMRGQNSEYGGYADGTFVRVGTGPVVLVKDALADWPRQSFAWVKAKLLELRRDDLVTLKGAVSNQTWTLTASNSTFHLAGLATNEELNTETSDAIASTLGWLDAAGVADPALKPAELGLAQPPTLDVATKAGLNYVIQVGTNAPGGRYVRLAASYVQPAAPTNFAAALASATNAAASNQVATLQKEYAAQVAADTKKIQEQQGLFGRFTYIVSDDTCRKLVPARSALVKLRPPPAPATNAVPAVANTPPPATTNAPPSNPPPPAAAAPPPK